MVFAFYKIYAQTSLVYNGDFELYDTCPTNFSQPGDYQMNTCLGWYIPSFATSDYFNTCNTTTVGVPNNFAGYQQALDGVGYCGLFANLTTPVLIPGAQSKFYHEYIQTKLLNRLKPNTKYKMIFYISLAENCGYSCKNIGAYFSNQPLSYNNWFPFITIPQIKSPDFVSDTINWIKVEGEFMAQGGEEYLTIGNFNDTLDFANDTLCIKPRTDWQDGSGTSYYYIDGITFTEEEIILPNVISPNGDGINDFIDLKLFENTTNFEFKIFNRWGQIVYKTNDVDDKWYGTNINHISLSDGVYYYILNYNEPIQTLTGFIQLFN
ncbi:MAG: gliding motility-associated C-terminal domain-containing protein [Bacteroidota bacterium]